MMLFWVFRSPRRWGFLLILAGLYAIVYSDGDTQKQEAGGALIVVGVLWFGFLVKDLIDLTRGPRLKKWEKTLDQGIDQAQGGNREAATQKFQQAVEQAGAAPGRLKADEQVLGILLRQRRTMEAIPFLRDSIRLRARSVKPDDKELGKKRLQLAEMYLTCGYFPHAIALLEQQAASGALVAEAKTLLGEAHALDGKSAEARAVLDAVIAQVTASSGQWDVALSDPLLTLAGIQVKASDLEGAEQNLVHAMGCAERVGAVDRTQRARAGLVEVYDRQGRSADALPILESYMKAATTTQGATSRATVPLLIDYGRLLSAVGRSEEGGRMTRRAGLIEAAAQRDHTPPGDSEAAVMQSYRHWWRRSSAEVPQPAPA